MKDIESQIMEDMRYDIINQFISDIVKKQNQIFMAALRTMAVPIIKGEITKGKLKWRGIRLCKLNDPLKYIVWLEQRGKQISPKIIVDYSIKFPVE